MAAPCDLRPVGGAPQVPDPFPKPEPPARALEGANVDDLYCLTVKRYGALGILEASYHDHIISRAKAEALLTGQLATLCPGDKAEIVLTRGAQVP